jgi:hypothetical protein
MDDSKDLSLTDLDEELIRDALNEVNTVANNLLEPSTGSAILSLYEEHLIESLQPDMHNIVREAVDELKEKVANRDFSVITKYPNNKIAVFIHFIIGLFKKINNDKDVMADVINKALMLFTTLKA